MATVDVTGSKRKAPDIGDQERLAKRFEVLNLSANGHKHYVPVASEEQDAAPRALPSPTSAPADEEQGMQVEDTKHRVYIHDLDRELAEVESDEDTPIFIPDIDKHLSKFPQRLLRSQEPRASMRDKQLILYSRVPNSISVAPEDDSVRQVLLESRNRARLEQRARIKREQKGEMDIEDAVADNGRPKRVFARLKWKDPPMNGGFAASPLPMSMEEADETTPEPRGPAVDDSDNDAMDIG